MSTETKQDADAPETTEVAASVAETKKEKPKTKCYSKPSYPIGTWKMPGGGAAYSQAPHRGEQVVGTGRLKKGGGK